MGDLHQPLHCADDSDRGGNEKLVRYQTPGNHGHGAKIKLHALWDGLIEVHTVENPRELALELEKNISNEDKRDWTKDEDAPLDSPPPTPTSQLEASLEVDWALESYRIAKTMIYKDMSPGPQDYSDTPLPLDYYSKIGLCFKRIIEVKRLNFIQPSGREMESMGTLANRNLVISRFVGDLLDREGLSLFEKGFAQLTQSAPPDEKVSDERVRDEMLEEIAALVTEGNSLILSKKDKLMMEDLLNRFLKKSDLLK
jgi:hypothetical protein